MVMHPSDAESLARIRGVIVGSTVDDEVRFNPNHSKSTGKFTSKGGGAGGGAGATANGGGAADPQKVVADLAAGKEATCRASDVDAIMKALNGSPPPPPNLSKLQVQGEGNEHCFRDHAREIPRSEMPQLPNNVAGLAPFTARLGQMGVTATLEKTDPRTLRATQNQLNAQKVAKLYGFMKETGWQEGAVMIAAKDGEILDGHHRWAAGAAVAASGTPIKIDVLRVNMGIDDLLAVSQEFSGQKMGMEAGLTS